MKSPKMRAEKMKEIKILSVASQSPLRGNFLPRKALITNAITGDRKIGAILPTVYCMNKSLVS
jgi:hypothetical protein